MMTNAWRPVWAFGQKAATFQAYGWLDSPVPSKGQDANHAPDTSS